MTFQPVWSVVETSTRMPNLYYQLHFISFLGQKLPVICLCGTSHTISQLLTTTLNNIESWLLRLQVVPLNTWNQSLRGTGYQELILDGGPQYFSREFTNFAKEYRFAHTMSSSASEWWSRAGSANSKSTSWEVRGSVPCFVDIHWATPITDTGYITAELLMSRKIRTTVPILPQDLKPKIPDFHKLYSYEKQLRDKQKQNFDSSK